MGGANAGHTILINGHKYVFHLIPSGILHDKYGKINVIGNGVVVHFPILMQEFSFLEKEKKSYNGLRISGDAHVTTPIDLVMEVVSELEKGKDKIGTTMRAIGPTYADKAARIGVRINDLYNKDFFAKKLKEKISIADALIRGKFHKSYGRLRVELEKLEKEKKIPFPLSGFLTEKGFDLERIVGKWRGYAKRIKEFVTNTQKLMRENYNNGKKILPEGAQGLLLDIDHGTYPFVTSSNCSAAGVISGAGMPPDAVDLVLGIAKMFYITRVGGGPLITEIFGEEADRIRERGGEYGASTGRPRRVGWLDLVALKYAIGINGPNIISTKTDVLDEMQKIKLCTDYTYDGPKQWANGREYRKGDIIDDFPADARILQFCKPNYVMTSGWMQDTSKIRSYDKLPVKERWLFDYVEKETGARIRIVSVGPDRKQTIIR